MAVAELASNIASPSGSEIQIPLFNLAREPKSKPPAPLTTSDLSVHFVVSAAVFEQLTTTSRPESNELLGVIAYRFGTTTYDNAKVISPYISTLAWRDAHNYLQGRDLSSQPDFLDVILPQQLPETTSAPVDLPSNGRNYPGSTLNRFVAFASRLWPNG
jgi:hypothetical protein